MLGAVLDAFPEVKPSLSTLTVEVRGVGGMGAMGTVGGGGAAAVARLELGGVCVGGGGGDSEGGMGTGGCILILGWRARSGCGPPQVFLLFKVERPLVAGSHLASSASIP